ncbi:hypothetical protein HDU93_000638, partial [Gonapodya sp. JEL0774]
MSKKADAAYKHKFQKTALALSSSQKIDITFNTDAEEDHPGLSAWKAFKTALFQGIGNYKVLLQCASCGLETTFKWLRYNWVTGKGADWNFPKHWTGAADKVTAKEWHEGAKWFADTFRNGTATKTGEKRKSAPSDMVEEANGAVDTPVLDVNVSVWGDDEEMETAAEDNKQEEDTRGL